MITKIINKSDYIKVDWQLSNVCNFDCPYCPDGTKNGTSGWPSLKQCFNSVDILNEKGKCEFTFSGGELTMWNEFPNLCSYIKQNLNNKINLITNGYRSYSYWERLNVDTIFYSWHPTSKLNIKRWCNNINQNKKNNRVFVLMYPDVWDKVVNDFEYMKKNLVNYESLELKYVDERNRKINYNDDQLNFIKNNSVLNFSYPKDPSYTVVIDNIEKHIPISEILTKKLNKFYGWKCNAGVKNIVFQINGNVSSTSACRVGNSLGNWHIGYFKFSEKPLNCNVQNCWCAPDIRIDKWI